MIARLRDRIKFALERFVLGGPLNRLLLIALVLGLLTIIGGAIVAAFGREEGAPSMSFGEALWWAFLRLSDPGYLGDDTGTVVRVVSTILTILGYVVFLGSLVAIMTQWLNSTLARLQAGYTPLALNSHVLILGWSARTIGIVREILLSEGRVKRFLRRRGAGRLRVVILAEEVLPEMFQELRERLGELWDPSEIILRTGSALRLEHLRRADFARAGAVLLPAPDRSADQIEYPDARVVKTILAMGASTRESGTEQAPLLVAELADARKLDIARAAYGGPIEVVASDLIIARLLAQNIRHQGLSHVYAEMLRHEIGSEIYLRAFEPLVGRRVGEVISLFPRAVPLGIVPREHGHQSTLNPPAGVVIEPGDRVVLLAQGYEDSEPDMRLAITPIVSDSNLAPQPRSMPARRRVLVLGWNHVIPALIRELDSYENESFELDLMSLVPPSVRTAELARFDAQARRSTIRLLEGEYTAIADVSMLDLAAYDNVVILSTDRLESEAERDARTMLGNLVLQQALAGSRQRPTVLMELLDPENVRFVHETGAEAILSPAAMSHILTQVALHRDLRIVYDDLFGPEGAEIFFRPAAQYGICDRPVRFADGQSAAMQRGETALGVRLASNHKSNGGVQLNPDRAVAWQLSDQDDIVVLANY